MARLRRYSAAVRITGPSAGAAYAVILPTSTEPIVIREIGLVSVAATATSVGLIRTLTTGTASTSTAGVAHNPNDAGASTTIKTAWSVAPTIAGSPVYIRRVALPATAGSSVLWTFPDDAPLCCESAATTALVLWNFGGSAASDVDLHVTWDES